MGMKNKNLASTLVLFCGLVSPIQCFATTSVVNCPVLITDNPLTERELFSVKKGLDGKSRMFKKLVGFEDILGEPKWKMECNVDYLRRENLKFTSTATWDGKSFMCVMKTHKVSLFGLIDNILSTSIMMTNFNTGLVETIRIDEITGESKIEESRQCDLQ